MVGAPPVPAPPIPAGDPPLPVELLPPVPLAPPLPPVPPVPPVPPMPALPPAPPPPAPPFPALPAAPHDAMGSVVRAMVHDGKVPVPLIRSFPKALQSGPGENAPFESVQGVTSIPSFASICFT